MFGIAKKKEIPLNDKITISNLLDKSAKQKPEIVAAVQSLERRIFPSSECLSITTETSQRNTTLLYATLQSAIVGYLIYINTASGIRIHKVCVANASRRQGIATNLIRRVIEVAAKGGKDIDLWVDEARIPARQCYAVNGFIQAGDVVVDYYAAGRNGIRMVWKCTS
jgi:ribosomal protein S18 acetylase RimI-like enzyme